MSEKVHFHSCGLVTSINSLKVCFFFFTTVVSQWNSSHGKFGMLSPVKASCDIVALPKLLCMLGVLVFHNPSNSNVDYRIFIVRTDVNACDCTRGCRTHVRESALKVAAGRKKIPCRTGESNLRQRCAGPTLYQLSYPPPPHTHTNKHTECPVNRDVHIRAR